ncbi:metallophosphoesterase family protein [Nocardioides rubriscoriae]|uniref:metallophosphoesterase family protein n=1 Tax=Nocardioides rubriscoriae TaxID=642762 RepID=UPI0011E03FC4|nr:metallophosphoesterase family protein [Nocardioides rubriscoriae]
MSREQIALVSDVHGNLTALEAVLADLDDRGITRVLNLGDYVGKGPRGRDVVAVCRERCEVNLLGNWDDVVGNPDQHPVGVDDPLRWWRDELDADQLPWLAGLPFCHDLLMSGRRVRLMHASAETVHRRVRYVKDEEEFLGQFRNTDATRSAVGETPEPDVVGYADTHDPFYETQLRGRTLFNTGSAGNAMGDPTASYCVLEGHLDEPDPAPFALTFVRVPYDVEAELAVARDLGVPDYAGYESELRLGLYRGARRDFEAGAFTLDTDYHGAAR